MSDCAQSSTFVTMFDSSVRVIDFAPDFQPMQGAYGFEGFLDGLLGMKSNGGNTGLRQRQ